MMVVKMEQGWDRARAATFAWTSTAFPMLTGTLVTAAGFLPVGFAKSSAGAPALDLAKPTGRKPAAVTRVPVSIGNAVEVQAKVAARARSQPCSIFTTIISMAMMA